MKEKLIDILKMLSVVIVVTFMISIPYLNFNPIFADDISYHTNRIISTYEELKAGHFPVLIHPKLLDGFGYAGPLFYPELFIYIPAILMFLGFNFLTSYKMLTIITTFFTILIAYFSANHIFKKKNIAWTIALLYSTAFYRITDIYQRGAIGEVLAIVFLPLVLAGLYEIIYGENKKWWIICFGIFGVANSHILSLAMIVIIILIVCLINVVKIFKDKKRLINLVLAGVVSILLICSFVLPYLEQSNNDKFNVDEKIWAPEFVQENSLSLKQMINNQIYVGDSYKGMGVLLLILPLFIFKCKNKDNETKFSKQLFVIGFISLLITSSLFPWKEICTKYRDLTTIQFPYRLNIITTLLFSFVSGYSICNLFNNKEEFNYIIYIGIVLISIGLIADVNPNIRNYVEEDILNLAPVGNGEYTPYALVKTDKNVHNINSNEKIEFKKESSKLVFNYEDSENEMIIHIPLAYYKGYVAYINEENGSKTELLVSEDEKTKNIIVSSDKIINGEITVEYKMTFIQIIGYVITYLTLFILICYIIYKKIREKNLDKIKN